MSHQCNILEASKAQALMMYVSETNATGTISQVIALIEDSV